MRPGDQELTTLGGCLCPVCRSEATREMSLGQYCLYRCRSCDSWSSDALARRVDTSFEPEAYFANADLDREKWDVLFDRLGASSQPRAILDVGCGNGAFLSYAGGRHPAALLAGVEVDPERAADARHRNPEAQIRVGDALSVCRSVDAPFDLITLWDVLEHVPAPTDLITALSTLLAPGGAIYVQTIHEQSLLPRVGRAIYRASAGRFRYPALRTHEAHHVTFFSLRGLNGLAERAGLAIEQLWFDRLARARMDGPPLLTAASSAALWLENRVGNGLFVNALMRPRA